MFLESKLEATCLYWWLQLWSQKNLQYVSESYPGDRSRGRVAGERDAEKVVGTHANLILFMLPIKM